MGEVASASQRPPVWAPKGGIAGGDGAGRVSEGRGFTGLRPSACRMGYPLAASSSGMGNHAATCIRIATGYQKSELLTFDSVSAADDGLKTPHVSHNSGENEWYTPVEIIEAARSCMGGIDLDPASSDLAQETVQAKHWFTKEFDGLDLI